MGDRTYCTLTLFGEVPEAIWPNLIERIEAEGDCDRFVPEERGQFAFEGVNYAEMPGDMRAFLRDHRISYCWRWDSGAEYGPGAEYALHDGSEWSEHTINEHRDHLWVVPVNHIGEVDQDQLRAIQFIQTFARANPFKLTSGTKGGATKRRFIIEVEQSITYRDEVEAFSADEAHMIAMTRIESGDDEFVEVDNTGYLITDVKVQP